MNTFKDNKVTTKDYLKWLDSQVVIWQSLVEEFPLSDAYKGNLTQLQQERAEFADRIGR